MAYFIETLILLFILSYLFYKWSTRKFNLFKERGVPFEKPKPLLGNVELDVLLGKVSVVREAIVNYRKYKQHKVYGSFSFTQPVFCINDLEFVKKIGIKDFDHFVNHNRAEVSDKDKVMARNLMALNDLQWKEMRNTLTPSFTGSKMRLMHEFVNECCQESVRFINDEIKSNGQTESCELELKDFFTRYANDIIGTVAFGIKVNSLKDKNNKFYEAGLSLTQFRGFMLFKALLFTLIPKVMKLLNISLMNQETMSYFRHLVFDAIKYRQANNIVRPDMIHLLLEAQQNFIAHGGKHDEIHATFDDDDLLAQCLIFFGAGFETVSNCLCFTLHELAINNDIQQQLYEEIMEIENELNGESLNYDSLMKMKYLDMVLSESLRKWPPAMFTDRLCTMDYVLKDDNDVDYKVEIKKGEQVLIPIIGFHHDEEYFPEPEKFIPERFSEDNKKSIRQGSYLPFGIGPRNCIGNRLALMETKTMIYHMIKNFQISPTEKTPLNLLEAMKGFQIIPPEKFWMKFTPRNTKEV